MSESKVTLSIIIPVYKSEAFIAHCMHSVIDGLPKDVELILVDDGSPDGSIEIAREICRPLMSQVKFLTQENAGPGAARNLGLDNANGDYIGFLDSDDVALDGYFDAIMPALRAGEVDIVEFGFRRFLGNPETGGAQIEIPSYLGCYELSSVRDNLFAKGHWFPWSRVFACKLFASQRFPVGVFYEDLMTIPFIYLVDCKIEFLDKALLGYRSNPESTTSRHKLAHAHTLIEFFWSSGCAGSSTALDLMRLRLARAIMYFNAEFPSANLPVDKIITEIRKLRRNRKIFGFIQPQDMIMTLAPNLYRYLDTLRVRPLEGRLTKSKTAKP